MGDVWFYQLGQSPPPTLLHEVSSSDDLRDADH